MTPPPDDRLDRLFVRYWDNSLKPSEADELSRLLAADPDARQWFQFLCFQAVAAAELPAIPEMVPDRRPAGTEPALPGPWSRRRILRYLGVGAAAAVAGFLGRRVVFDPLAPTALEVIDPQGTVMLRTDGGELSPAVGFVPAGGVISTQGPGSSVVLRYPDGTSIALAGDSAVSRTGTGRRLLLHQGTAMLCVTPQAADSDPLTLLTAEAILIRLSAVVVTLGHNIQATEVGVQQGLVTVARPNGESLAVVNAGEVLTVRADGDHLKQSIQTPPDRYNLDLARPLPGGWAVGTREGTPDGMVLRPTIWFDPYHKAEMYQIRSDSQWTRGFFRLYPGSVIRVRYWVDQPGPGQLVVCARTGRSSQSESGVLDCNDAFAKAKPRAWQELNVRAGDMLDNMNAPRFEAPWVGFLLIFNTYKVDLGLKVAELRVIPPDGDDREAAPE